MNRTYNRIIRSYYYAAPVFWLLDVLGLNIRVAFLDDFPVGKTAYYAFLCVLAVAVWAMPRFAAHIALIESSADVGILIITVWTWYFAQLEAIQGEAVVSPDVIPPTALVNFVMSAAVAAIAYLVALRRVSNGSRD